MQIVIDSLCATFAEVQKRGKDFWAEFELYAADLLVGIVVDIALVGMLAPYARIGKRSVASGGLFSGLKNSVAALPSRLLTFLYSNLVTDMFLAALVPDATPWILDEK